MNRDTEYLKRVKEHVNSVDLKNYNKKLLAEELAEIFKEVYRTKLVSANLTDENGNVLVPGVLTDNSGKDHTVLMSINVKDDFTPYYITIIDPDLDYVDSEDYREYLEPWDGEFVPYTTISTVNVL